VRFERRTDYNLYASVANRNIKASLRKETNYIGRHWYCVTRKGSHEKISNHSRYNRRAGCDRLCGSGGGSPRREGIWWSRDRPRHCSRCVGGWCVRCLWSRLRLWIRTSIWRIKVCLRRRVLSPWPTLLQSLRILLKRRKARRTSGLFNLRISHSFSAVCREENSNVTQACPILFCQPRSSIGCGQPSFPRGTAWSGRPCREQAARCPPRHFPRSR
jgi:hypothetical protein